MEKISSKKQLSELLKSFEKGTAFSAKEITVDQEVCTQFVQMVIDPQRFQPKIFDGNWAFPDRHPTPGSLKLLRCIEGNDGQLRIIARQADKVYAYPWI